jgi:hypothetical protein
MGQSQSETEHQQHPSRAQQPGAAPTPQVMVFRPEPPQPKEPSPCRTSWERGLGRRVPQGAATAAHVPWYCWHPSPTARSSGCNKPPCTPRHATRPCGPVRFKAAARRLRRCPLGSLEPASPARHAHDAPPRWRGEWLGPFTSAPRESMGHGCTSVRHRNRCGR